MERQLPTSKYKIWGWGPALNMGATGSSYVGVSAVAKKATTNEPFIVANELVCSLIARSLFLPCPPGALLDRSGEVYFYSLDFNHSGHALPPVTPSNVAASAPEMSWVVTLFDILVMNPDRHNQNLSFDTTTNRLTIFDHSHALVGTAGDITQRLNHYQGVPQLGAHCLAPELNHWTGFQFWSDRIKQLPDYCLSESVDAGCEVGIPPDKKTLIYDFLRARRDGIDSIVTNNKAQFPKLP